MQYDYLCFRSSLTLRLGSSHCKVFRPKVRTFHRVSLSYVTQGSHSHGKSWKVMEKKAVMESHGKVMETEENK